MNNLNKLRKVVHDTDEDTLLAKFGFQFDKIMNSSYHCALYLLNIFLLFWTEDVADIILNALAIEFIKNIDEAITAGCWYDSDYRYLKAGAFENVIRHYVNFHKLDRCLKRAATEIKIKDANNASSTAARRRMLRKMISSINTDQDKNDKADDLTISLTTAPKEFFYTWRTYLRRWEKGKAEDLSIFGKLVKGLLSVVPKVSGGRAIFDKWEKMVRAA